MWSEKTKTIFAALAKHRIAKQRVTQKGTRGELVDERVRRWFAGREECRDARSYEPADASAGRKAAFSYKK